MEQQSERAREEFSPDPANKVFGLEELQVNRALCPIKDTNPRQIKMHLDPRAVDVHVRSECCLTFTGSVSYPGAEHFITFTFCIIYGRKILFCLWNHSPSF